MTLTSFVSHFGVIPIFLGCFVEGETVAIAGGVLAKHHLLQLWHVVVAAALGAFTSDMLYFWLARQHRDHPWVTKILERGALAWISDNVDKHPGLVASSFRFVPGCRIIGPIFLGRSQISTREFALRAGATACVWSVVYVAAGHTIATLLQTVMGEKHPLYKIVLVTLVLAVMGIVIAVRRREKRLLPHAPTHPAPSDAAALQASTRGHAND